ncbi:serum amyloid A protein-like [Pyxicephalus adspersus]|uniref:serum amyloid A protein-like n=1 Tax=Pyxicephalus adspersus TaxID=30357 RepID=UPI003B5C4EEA
MKASLILLLIGLAVAQAQFQWLKDSAKFAKDAALGSYDMARAYKDMRDANFKNSDKYFHARGNYDAIVSSLGQGPPSLESRDAREAVQMRGRGRGAADSQADQEANRWGRNGGNPNRYRPNGLPRKY